MVLFHGVSDNDDNYHGIVLTLLTIGWKHVDDR